jgi:PIN domain nuclease of toxin-antitoxin system
MATPRPLLLDTVAFILWHADSPRLSARAKSALLSAPTQPVYVSAASAFEIATKVRLGKLHVPSPLLHDFTVVVERDGFRVIDVDPAAAVWAGQIESEHRDPFDRLIAAQAHVLGGDVVTTDPAFAQLGVSVFW